MPTSNSISGASPSGPLDLFHPAVRQWFASAFPAPTLAQQLSWPAIARGESTLLLAPTGSGKTLAAFLWCLNRAMFSPVPPKAARCRALYISPLKALAVDVERNLRFPLEQIAEIATERGDAFHLPVAFVRTGDTPSAERARFQRQPADILITTPESLYLMLTSNARQALQSVETVIVDEIHALVPTKRGAHLALSLERLEQLCGRPLQRIGLSATQRPLSEVSRFLSGVEVPPEAFADPVDAGSPSDPEDIRYRPVTVLDASTPKRLELSVQVPVEDMSKPGEKGGQSIWTSIHPELLELVRAHQSTLIFVNNRRLAERISGALNDLAGETLVLAHHGSVAPAQRKEIEERLKSGTIKGLVATSSLELGIDMGAIDLVVQIEAPPSVSSGMQRIGRAGHHVGAVSNGIIFPKFRADLLACAAATRAMRQGQVESIRYPRNPLDVLAQQVVATVAMEHISTDALFDMLRRAAPFAALSRTSFESVLDLLSGRYPSDEFAELRPRITWNRLTGELTPRESAQRLALVNGGTIPDRGLYGVYLVAAEKPTRLGELDEEMVFETKPGETIILGASTWRIAEITHDRVIVNPAPGEPGKMPFWHGDGAGRPAEFGQHIGELSRELLRMPAAAAFTRLVEDHSLAPNAAENLLRFLRDQQQAAMCIPSDEEILIERCRDELGDWRICVLSPYGSRVHAPWCMAVAASLRHDLGLEPETMWADDGFVIRLPESDQPPDSAALLPSSDSIYDRTMRQLGGTALFAARFRENAARALLLPRRRPGMRTPLWQQRKRSADLLNVASRYPSFAILLETYRECIRDVFDLPALTGILRRIEQGTIRVTTVDSVKPSPFAASLLFGYVANYIYDGDAPLAERRAQALSIDQSQLQDLLGDADYRELLDPSVLQEVETQLQRLGSVRHADGIHDLLLRLGDLTPDELRLRCKDAEVFAQVDALVASQRVLLLTIGGLPSNVPGCLPSNVPVYVPRYVAVEHAAQYRDALGAALPPGLAATWLQPQPDPLLQVLGRFARNRGPFTLDDLCRRYRLSKPVAESALAELVRKGALLEGGFRPGGVHREWIHPDVLQQLRRKTLARLRREVSPLPAHVLGRFLPRWQGIGSKRHGLGSHGSTHNASHGSAHNAAQDTASVASNEDMSKAAGGVPHNAASGNTNGSAIGSSNYDALLDAIETLQGLALPLSEWEREILPARIRNYDSVALDTLMAAGELVWVGRGALGEHDGRVAIYLADSLPALLPPAALQRAPATLQRAPAALQAAPATLQPAPVLEGRAQLIAEFLAANGASFFAALHQAAGAGFPGETSDALWQLAWQGIATNDTFHSLRSYLHREREGRSHSQNNFPPGSAEYLKQFRSRTRGGALAQGRWSLVSARVFNQPTVTSWSANIAQQLLLRYGLVTRETAAAEEIPGGFSAVYPALRQMEERGWIRRGMFISGLGGSQFAMNAAVESLRALRTNAKPTAVVLAAVDPANPYGTLLSWPRLPDSEEAAPSPHGMARTSGASVLLVEGELVAYLRRGNPSLKLFLPTSQPEQDEYARAAAHALARLAIERQALRSGVLISEINTEPARQHIFGHFLEEAGFVPTPLGYQMRRAREGSSTQPEPADDELYDDTDRDGSDAPDSHSEDSYQEQSESSHEDS
jgi:ATP-dependent Lhr-like helicase